MATDNNCAICKQCKGTGKLRSGLLNLRKEDILDNFVKELKEKIEENTYENAYYDEYQDCNEDIVFYNDLINILDHLHKTFLIRI